MKLKTEINKYENIIRRKREKLDKITSKAEKEIKELEHKAFKLSLRQSHMRDLQRKNCHHKKEYGRREWRNNRDDRSFTWYVACKKCDATLWDECYGERGPY